MDNLVFVEFHFLSGNNTGRYFFVGKDLAAILNATNGGTKYGDYSFNARKVISEKAAKAGSPFGLSTTEELIRLMEKRDVPYASLGSIQ